jgi:hypothetical protein
MLEQENTRLRSRLERIEARRPACASPKSHPSLWRGRRSAASDPGIGGRIPPCCLMLADVLGSLCLLVRTRLAVLRTTVSCRHAVATPGRSTATYGDGSEGLLLDGCAP